MESLREERQLKLSKLSGKERTLQLAGTMSLKNRAYSPLGKLRQTRGFVTIKRVQDIDEQKAAHAIKRAKNNERGEFSPPKEYQFKNYDTLKFGQKDFVLRKTKPVIDNPHGLSQVERRPRMHIEKEHKDMIKAEIEQGLIGCPKWNVVNKLPMPHQPMTQQIKDPYAKGVKKEQTNHLEKEQWEPVYTVLARTI